MEQLNLEYMITKGYRKFVKQKMKQRIKDAYNGIDLKIILPSTEEKFSFTYDEVLEEILNQIKNVEKNKIVISSVGLKKDVFSFLINYCEKHHKYYETPPYGNYTIHGYELFTY